MMLLTDGQSFRCDRFPVRHYPDGFRHWCRHRRHAYHGHFCPASGSLVRLPALQWQVRGCHFLFSWLMSLLYIRPTLCLKALACKLANSSMSFLMTNPFWGRMGAKKKARHGPFLIYNFYYFLLSFTSSYSTSETLSAGPPLLGCSPP